MVEDCILILLLQINRRIVIDYSDIETSYLGWYRKLYY